MKQPANIRNTADTQGFTLVEVLLAMVTLALMTTAISALYITCFQVSNTQNNGILLDSALRSEMEALMSETFGDISDGSVTVPVEGNNYTISWTVSLADLNGDAVTEPTAKQIMIQIDEAPNRTLSVIVVNHEGRVGKL